MTAIALDEVWDRVVAIGADPTVARVIAVVVGAVVIMALRRLAQRGLVARIHDGGTRYRARKALGFGSWLLIVLVVLVVFADRLGGMGVAFGVAGAGIAFALQEVIASVAGWIALTFGTFYKVGDRVMLGGIKGDVIDIGVLRTTLFELGDWVSGDLYNGRVVRVANSFVFKEPVFNYSGEFPFLWDEITIPIRHGSDRVAARELLERVMNEECSEYIEKVRATWDTLTRTFLIEKAQLEPAITLAADHNWLAYTVRYVVDHKRRRTTKDHLFERILDEIDASEGRVSLASSAQEITLMTPSRAPVAVERA